MPVESGDARALTLEPRLDRERRRAELRRPRRGAERHVVVHAVEADGAVGRIHRDDDAVAADELAVTGGQRQLVGAEDGERRRRRQGVRVAERHRPRTADFSPHGGEGAVVGDDAREGRRRGQRDALIRAGIHDGRIVDGRDRDRHGRRVRERAAVAGPVREAVDPVEVRVRRVREAAVRVQHDGSVRGGRHDGCREGRAVDVRIVGQHAGRVHDERDIFGRGVRSRPTATGASFTGLTVIVTVAAARAGLAVARGVGEGVGPGEIRLRRIEEAAVGIERQAAVGRRRHELRRQRRSGIGVGVVGEHAGGRHAERDVLIDAVAVVGRDRRVVRQRRLELHVDPVVRRARRSRSGTRRARRRIEHAVGSVLRRRPAPRNGGFTCPVVTKYGRVTA